MAKKKSPKKAKKAKKAAKKSPAKKTVKKAVRRIAKKATKRTAPKARKPLKKKTLTKKAVRKAPVAKKPVAKKAAPARLMRERKRLPEVELEEFSGPDPDARLLNSARTGHDELRAELHGHTAASPELTAGDVDAKWQDAYAVGDEAPGGDNMTPDQDRVDDIGKALGVEYDDDEELMGGDEIAERDAHRWELDPASKEDEE